jgi:hypothetical protein
MTYEGIARGKFIEFSESLPYHGQAVRVSIELMPEQTASGSAATILQAVQQPPHLVAGDVDDLEREIGAGTLSVQAEGLFDAPGNP